MKLKCKFIDKVRPAVLTADTLGELMHAIGERIRSNEKAYSTDTVEWLWAPLGSVIYEMLLVNDDMIDEEEYAIELV